MADRKIVWYGPEYSFQAKRGDWFLALWIASASVAVLATIFRNILFAVFILVSCVAITLYANRKPREVEFTLDERGISINGQLYPYAELETFWIDERTNKLIFTSHRLLSTHLVAFIGGAPRGEIRDLLLDYLLEEEHPEPLAEKIMSLLGF